MERMRRICGDCKGFGYYTDFDIISEDKTDPTKTVCELKHTQRTCEVCNGNGYIEYAVFSIEEAEAILTHCGLSVEGGN